MDFDFDTAEKALEVTGCSSMEAALDYAWNNPSDTAPSYTAPPSNT